MVEDKELKKEKSEEYGFPEHEHDIEIIKELDDERYKAIAKCKLCPQLYRVTSNGEFEKIKLED